MTYHDADITLWLLQLRNCANRFASSTGIVRHAPNLSLQACRRFDAVSRASSFAYNARLPSLIRSLALSSFACIATSTCCDKHRRTPGGRLCRPFSGRATTLWTRWSFQHTRLRRMLFFRRLLFSALCDEFHTLPRLSTFVVHAANLLCFKSRIR